MKKKFNLSAYKKLLKLEENGKISFMDQRYLELLDYKADVEVQITYNRKVDYFLLIHDYLIQVTTPYEFRCKLIEMTKEDSMKATIIRENFQQLEDFSIAENLDKFSGLMGKISNLCFDYDEVWDGTMKPMSEAEFRSLVNNYYLQLQEAFPVNIWEISNNKE